MSPRGDPALRPPPERLAPALSPRPGGEGGSWEARPRRRTANHGGPVANRRSLAAVLAGLLLLLLGVPIVVGIGLALTAPRPAEVERRWRDLAGFDPLVAFPARAANATALSLEATLRPLGLDLAPAGSPRRAPLLPASVPWLGPLAERAHHTLDALRTPRPRLQPGAAGDGAALAAARPVLLATREVLLAGEPPRWELDLGRGWLVETPDLRRHQLLHRLLLFAAHEAEREGEPDEALAWLQAAWNLRVGLAADPVLATQRVALAELHDELALLRALRRPLPEWRQRLAGMRVAAPVDRALRIEGWMAARGLGDYAAAVASDERWSRRLLRSGSWLLARHGARHVVDATDHAIVRARRGGARELHGRFLGEELARVPGWSRLAHTLLGNALEMPLRAARSTLATELTVQALALEELRASGGAPPATHPSAVGGVTWRYERRPGFLVVRPSQEIPVAGRNPLPLRLELPWEGPGAPAPAAPP